VTGTDHHPGCSGRLPAPGLRPQTTDGASRPELIEEGGLDGQGQEYGEDGGPAHRPVPRPAPRCRADRHGRHPEPGRDPFPSALIEPGMHSKEPGGKLQTAPLRPAPPAVVPRAVRRPPLAPGPVHGGAEKRVLPRRPSRLPVQEQRSRWAAGRHRLTPVGEMPRWVERVAAMQMHRTAHHCQRETRTGLARTIVIDEQRAPLRTCGKGAARRKYRSKPPILVCLIRRRDEKRLARISAPCHIFPCGVVASVAASTRTRHITLKPATLPRRGLLTVCSLPVFHNLPVPHITPSQLQPEPPHAATGCAT